MTPSCRSRSRRCRLRAKSAKSSISPADSFAHRVLNGCTVRGGRIQMRAMAIALVCVVASAAISSGVLVAQSGAARPPVTAAQYEQWKRDLSNWGRWGKDDQIGALNLITPAKRRQAAALVTDGISVSLAADADTMKAVDNPTPYEVTMQGIGSDRLAVSYH